MGDYYHHFLTSMAGVGGHPSPHMLDPSGQMAQPPPLMPMAPIPGPYQNLGYFTGFPEPIMFNATKSQRSRRKSTPGLDHIKHRRTRSGCYTCRSRRVKCDETHPICERCRKGKRECTYPEPPASKGGSGNNSSKESSSTGRSPSQQASPTSSRGDDNEDEDEPEQDTKLEPIMDEDEDEPESATSTTSTANFPPLRRTSTTSSFGRPRGMTTDLRQGSETPSFDGKSSSPGSTSSQTPTGVSFPDLSTATTPTTMGRPDWTFLPHDLQCYLSYFYDNVTHYHYGMVHDVDDFFRSVLIGLALRHEALLYAIVGFAAYHHAMRNPNGRINEFLQYYNRSVTLLLECLKKKEKYTLGTLFTILQLATIEEFLGDWINLMCHQKAAFEVLTNLFTSQTAMQTPTGRMAAAWYGRFDVFISLMGTFKPTLVRDWYSARVDFYSSRVATEPQNIGLKIEYSAGSLQLILYDMALLYARQAAGEMSIDEYMAEHVRLNAVWERWRTSWDPALSDPAHRIDEFPGNPTPSPEDIVNPFAPGVLYRPPLFAMSLLVCEHHSIALLHASHQITPLTDEDRARLRDHAYAACQISEAVEFWPHSPPGSLVTMQSCLAIATLSLPKDEKHCMWFRRKFAMLESIGYITPVTTRTRISQLLNDESLMRWWLPNDEGFTPLLQTVRAIADERNAVAAAAQQENMKQIHRALSRMNLGHDKTGDRE